MNTSLLPKSKLSYERSFDDMLGRRHILFRLHSHTLSWTSFYTNEKVLVASLQCQKLSKGDSSEELSLRLAALEMTSPSSTLMEDSEAIVKHITSWRKQCKEPSDHISLTFEVLYVLWMWKLQISLPQSEGRQDDFGIIILNGSKLRGAKLGTQLLSRKKDTHKEAHRFAEQHDEVIVAKYIQSEAILGSMPMSRLEPFVPSWCRKLFETGSKKSTFRDSLPSAVDRINCAMVRESLRFSLVILAPMLVPIGQQRANISSGKEAGCSADEHSRTESMCPRAEPTRGQETMPVSGHRVAEDSESRTPASYGKRSCSLEIGSLLAGMAGGSPKQEPPVKRRRFSEEEQPLHELKNEHVRPSDAEEDGQASAEFLKWECNCIVALATEVCRVNENGRKECQRLLEVHVLELLNRYRTAMQRVLGRGEDPLETLRKIMDEYEGWDEGTRI